MGHTLYPRGDPLKLVYSAAQRNNRVEKSSKVQKLGLSANA